MFHVLSGSVNPLRCLRKKAAATPATPEGQLLKAARSGSLMSVMRLLQMGVDPNASPLALVQGSGQHFEMRLKAMFMLWGAGSAQRMQTPTRKRALKWTGTFRHWNQSSKIHLIPDSSLIITILLMDVDGLRFCQFPEIQSLTPIPIPSMAHFSNLKFKVPPRKDRKAKCQ